MKYTRSHSLDTVSNGGFLQFSAGAILPSAERDSEDCLRLRKAVLEQDGYNVVGVTDTDEALQVLRKAPVCLRPADHMLRGTTGTQLAAEMKKIRPDVPIVLYSGRNPTR